MPASVLRLMAKITPQPTTRPRTTPVTVPRVLMRADSSRTIRCTRLSVMPMMRSRPSSRRRSMIDSDNVLTMPMRAITTLIISSPLMALMRKSNTWPMTWPMELPGHHRDVGAGGERLGQGVLGVGLGAVLGVDEGDRRSRVADELVEVGLAHEVADLGLVEVGLEEGDDLEVEGGAVGAGDGDRVAQRGLLAVRVLAAERSARAVGQGDAPGGEVVEGALGHLQRAGVDHVAGARGRDQAGCAVDGDGLAAERGDRRDPVDVADGGEEVVVQRPAVARHDEVGALEVLDLADGEVLQAGAGHGHERHQEHADQQRVGGGRGALRAADRVVDGELALQPEAAEHRVDGAGAGEGDERAGHEGADHEEQGPEAVQGRSGGDEEPEQAEPDEDHRRDPAAPRHRAGLGGRLAEGLDGLDPRRPAGRDHDRGDGDDRAGDAGPGRRRRGDLDPRARAGRRRTPRGSRSAGRSARSRPARPGPIPAARSGSPRSAATASAAWGWRRSPTAPPAPAGAGR